MAKFNFFKGGNKLDNLEPSEIQQQIDEKHEEISKLEADIKKTDEFLDGVSEAYHDDIVERKKELEAVTEQSNSDVIELKVKKDAIAKKRQSAIDKKDNEVKKTTKAVVEIKEKHDLTKDQINNDYINAKEKKKLDVDKFKASQDKKFISERNELIEEVNKQKETLSTKAMKALESQKKEISVLRSEIEKIEASHQDEINKLKEKLSSEVEAQKITHDAYVVEINNLKASQQSALDLKRAEIDSKLNQWKSDFNQFAATNKDFIERKKAELSLLREREESLRETLKQKQRNIEIERKNLQKDHDLRVEELNKVFSSVAQRVKLAQQEYETESNLYEKEVEAFKAAQDEEKNKVDEIISALGKELEEFKHTMSEEHLKLDNRFKDDCNSIMEFYRDLLAKEETKHRNNLLALEADIQRDEQNFLVDKKALEDKKAILENNFIETVKNIKDNLVKCNELMKTSEVEHKALILSLQKDFEENKAKYEESLSQKQQEYQKRKLEIEEEVKKSTEDVKEQLKKIDDVNTEISKQISQSELSLNNLKEDFNQIASEKQNEINKLNSKLVEINEILIDAQEKRRDEKNRHESKMRDFTLMRQQLVAEHRQKIDEIRSNYDSKVKEYEEMFVSKKKEIEDKHQLDLQSLNDANQAKIEELEKNRAALNLQYEKEKAVYDTKLHELEATHAVNLQNENARLKDATNALETLRQNQKNEVEQTKERFSNILSDLRLKIDNQISQLKDQESNYKQDISIRIQQSREELNRLKNEENSLIDHISEIQQKFDTEKNALIKSTSRFLDEHLEKVGNLESQIASKRSEIDATEESLRDLVNYFVECEEEEKNKLENLKNIFKSEQLDQSAEIEASIAKLIDQKNSQLDVIRARFEAERKRLTQQLEDEIKRHQSSIEEEKTIMLEEQAKLDKEYADKIISNNAILEDIKKQIKQFQNEAIAEENRFKSELSRLEKAHDFDKGQLEYELELKSANNEKYLEDLRISFEQEQNEINLEKTRLINAIDLKQKALDDKKAMFESFFAKFQEEESARKSDREYEILQYEKNIEELQKHIEQLHVELEQTKAENQTKLDEVIAQQNKVKEDYENLINNRSETFNLAVEKVKAEHEKDVTDYMSQCDAQQAELKIQNDSILRAYQEDFDTYKAGLMRELDEKREDIAKKIAIEEAKLKEEKEKFETYLNELRTDEETRIAQRNEERARLNTYWTNGLQVIRDRIDAAVSAFDKDKEKIIFDNEQRIKAITEERINLESDEKRVTLDIQELENAFSQKKREVEEKARQYEEECYLKIANIDRVIRQKEEKINSYREEIKGEVLRAIEERKTEEQRLNEIVLAKEQLLAEEKEKIMTVIQKQQKIFEKLAAKKRAAMDDEILRNNKILERELRRIENEKEKVGEDFSLTLEELNRMILEKERNYEELIAQQKAKNEAYLNEFRRTLQENHDNEVKDDRREAELASKLKEDMLVKEQEVLGNLNEELSSIRNEHLTMIEKLQLSNNQVEGRLNTLRKQFNQLVSEYESDEDSQKHKAFFDEFDRLVQERRQTIKELEEQEFELRNNKLEQMSDQNDQYNKMLADHQERVLSIENEIYLEQKKLTDFEEDISRRRREQKEMEINARNLFTKKLDYLKQKMFDN